MIMKKVNLFFLSATILFLVPQMSANAQIEGLDLPADWTATTNGQTTTISYSGNKIVKNVKVIYKGEGFTTSEEGNRILFSKGNLQYHPKNKKWQFAEHQYDRLARENNNHITEDSNWWIDLFGWGTADNPTLSTSTESQYASFKEWGNKVSDSHTTWRTLKGREWWYILTERENAKNLYGVATVNEIKGLIILPDNWVLPIGLTFKPGVSESAYEAYGKNIYTIEQWERMEAAGAVFLPVCGHRDGNTSGKMNVIDTDHGYYWASDYDNNTTDYTSKAYHVEIYWKYCNSKNNSQKRHYGSSVRLVKNASSMNTERNAQQDYTTKKWSFEYYTGTTTTAHVEVEYEAGSVTAGFSTNSYAYTGSEQKPNPMVLSGSTTLANTKYVVNYPDDIINAGNKTCTITVQNNGGGSFDINASYTITPKQLALSWSNTSLVYNGTEQVPTATVSGAIGNDVPTVSVSGGKINKGTYTATATLSSNPNSNYTLSSTTHSFTIAQKELTLSWGNTSFVYDGTEHSPTATISGAVGNDNPTVTVSGGMTNKGTYTATASLSNNPNSNYKLPSTKTQSFTINPKEVALDWDETELTYNGSAQKPTATATDLVGNDVCNVTVTGEQTNAGSYTATATTLSNTNYKLPEIKTSQYTIAPKVVDNPTIELSATSYTYDGTAKKPTVSVKDENITIPSSEYYVSYADSINAGMANVTITDKADGNYTVSGSVTYNITPKIGVVATITGNSKTTTYNSEEQNVEGYTVSINDELNIYSESDFSFNGDSTVIATTAGTYPMQLSANNFSNLNPNFADVQFVIENGALTINKAPEAPNKPEATIETRFINTQLVTLPENWQWAENKALELGNNTITAEYKGTDAGNYVLESVDIAITRLECQHNEGNDILYAVAPTCTKAGYSGNFSCKLCGKIYEYGDSIPATGHKADSVAFENIVEATCTTAGSKDSVVYCSVCKAEVSRTKVTLPAHGHTAVVDAAVAATTTSTGLTEGSHCSVCGETIVAQIVIPMLTDNGNEENQGGNENGNENQGGENQGGNENQGGGNQSENNEGENNNNNQENENNGGNNQGENENGNENQGGENTEPATAVAESTASAVNIYATGNTIVVENTTDEIFVYNVMGGLVVHGTDTTITVSHTGVYIVKTGNIARRVMITQ